MSVPEVFAQLQAMFPKRIALTAEEVAQVLRGKSTRGVVQRVREGMKEGRYPGARKIDGHWQLPLSDLAKILSPNYGNVPVHPEAYKAPPPGKPRTRRRSQVVPRLTFIREGQFWERVARLAGWGEEADAIHQEWESVLNSWRDEARAQRASKSKGNLLDELSEHIASKHKDKGKLI